MCAGQIAGCEPAAHSVRQSFQESETDAALLIDASNTFNSLNRTTALHNVRHICPSFSTILINTYQAHSDLYIDGEVLHSQERTTHGDPLAMPFYALATIPIQVINQPWYVDVAAATGRVSCLRCWWNDMEKHSPSFGYHANASLVVKPDSLEEALSAFGDTIIYL